jgi:hypothetical protein
MGADDTEGTKKSRPTRSVWHRTTSFRSCIAQAKSCNSRWSEQVTLPTIIAPLRWRCSSGSRTTDTGIRRDTDNSLCKASMRGCAVDVVNEISTSARRSINLLSSVSAPACIGALGEFKAHRILLRIVGPDDGAQIRTCPSVGVISISGWGWLFMPTLLNRCLGVVFSRVRKSDRLRAPARFRFMDGKARPYRGWNHVITGANELHTKGGPSQEENAHVSQNGPRHQPQPHRQTGVWL